jgi:nucleoside-diphosphate-sugar epimerase
MSFWEGKKVLVTGGAGFIGSHLVDQFVEIGAIVTVVDNLERGKLAYLEKNLDKIKFVKADLLDITACNNVVKGMDVVMNLAAKVTGIEYNRYHHGDMFTTNMTIASNVIEAARKNRVKRFLCVSTACIYPHDAKVPTPESEGNRGGPEPTNEGYGWAKRMAEKQAMYYAREYDMEIAIARPFNAYGPRDHYDEGTSHVIPALIKRVLDGNDPIVVWGTGNQSRAFLHAEDFARGLILVTEKYAVGDPVNIGHDKEITMRQLVELILQITDKNPKVVFDTSKPDGYPRRAADSTKLKNVTGGFVPSIPLEQGIKEMIFEYQEGKFQK